MKTSKNSHHGVVSRIPKDILPSTNDPKRTVHIGYRPVGGMVAAWTIGMLDDILKRLSLMDAHNDQTGPNPHHHWCIIVGHYYHHAQIANGLMWYENDLLNWSKSGLPQRKRIEILVIRTKSKMDFFANDLGHNIEDGWSLFEVGETTLNDAAIVEAGEYYSSSRGCESQSAPIKI